MAERREEVYYDEEEQKLQVNDANETEENASIMMQDSIFLLKLNLVMVMASLSLSNEELSDFDDMEKLSVKDEQEYKTFVSKLHSHKRGFDELKIPDRRASRSRVQTKVIDSRHGRKV
ncbi:hypothetical protein BVRB_1g003510 [Beta vulgaris subsp. vulgaris]|uniref:uncharacterized protein LOC104886586 n=1 Tax=Beta vulgaris subsp. vulgaris TaxID=3555 RepID=UPI00053F9BED|nr:uncharacterized protein LOC104886586 [Beta vulgaris subsp. vulgaris]XP_048492966.1 uncharacterized protein LOC104886586 [Beta vulgaris subsp. vulgaris]KMT20352.1 hypothetical protein BVRB_1g003510 [Beta vulgaris subsp. vulgaris]